MRFPRRDDGNKPGLELEPRAQLAEVGVEMSLRKESPFGNQLACPLEGGTWGAGVVSKLVVTCTPSCGHTHADTPHRTLQSSPLPS